MIKKYLPSIIVSIISLVLFSVNHLVIGIIGLIIAGAIAIYIYIKDKNTISQKEQQDFENIKVEIEKNNEQLKQENELIKQRSLIAQKKAADEEKAKLDAKIKQQEIEKQELENKRKENILKRIDEYNKELNSIPKTEIKLSDLKINNQAVSNMPEITFTKPRKNSSIFSFSEFVVIDTETSGLKLRDEILEVSAIKFCDFEPVEAFTTLIKPNKPITEEITSINGITNEMIKDAPKIKQVIPALDKFIGNSNILGHNLLFDLRFLYKYGYDVTAQKRKYFDTLSIAKSKLVKYDDDKFDRSLERDTVYDWDVDDYKLDTLCEHYGIVRNNAHRALSDCLATAKVFENLLRIEYELSED
ncbi:MAG: exonuclease domain-containing protein [Oscillospiraceae bacterium]